MQILDVMLTHQYFKVFWNNISFFSKLSTILLHIYEILYHQQKENNKGNLFYQMLNLGNILRDFFFTLPSHFLFPLKQNI